MMDIRDLSIGDWVLCEGEYWKVSAINEDSVGLRCDSDSAIATLEECDPIPLTPEILEKNGFFHNGKKWYTPELFTLERWLDDWTIIIACACGDYVCEVCTIKYVHQLQHALRLVGVEKEIEV